MRRNEVRKFKPELTQYILLQYPDIPTPSGIISNREYQALLSQINRGRPLFIIEF
jgi:hypothetical protein